MYSEEFDNNNSYNGEQYVDYDYQQEGQKPSFWDDNKGLIIKIIIIILCVLILIWLFSKITGNKNNNTNNNENSMLVYNNNVDTIRIALEKYFFVEGNLPKDGNTAVVTLNELNVKGYVGKIVDANDNACDANYSTASLVKGLDSYVLTINLTCGSVTEPKVYNYEIETYKCLNCSGFTFMDGTTDVPNADEDEDEKENQTDEDEKEEVDDEKTAFEKTLSCKKWSDWTEIVLNDDSLDVRTRVLVKGIKKGGVKQYISYTPWSEYTTTPITPSSNVQVETEVRTQETWTPKTSDTEVVAGTTIRNVQKVTTGSGSYSYCPSGYKKENGKCVKYVVKTGNLTYTQYNSYNVLNKPCDGPFVIDGKTIIKNCQYQVKETVDLKYGSSSKTSYTYEELSTTQVTYYRSRTIMVSTVTEDSVITDGYMEESSLPSGYVKLEGSEKTQYSYKIKVCEK